MRILFVHEVNYRSKVVYEIHDFPELLAERGHEVVFVDFPEGDARKGWRRVLDLRTEVRSGVHRAHPGASVEVRTPGRVLPPPLDRLVASVTHVPVIAKALWRGRVDAVVLYGVPTNGWQTVFLARRARVPVLFRAIDVSHQLRPTLYTRLIRQAEHYVYRRADAVSVNNVGLRRYALAAGAEAETVSVEYPGIDLDRFRPGPKPPELLGRYGLSASDRVVLFMGTLFRFAGLDWLFDEMAETLRRRDDLKILVMGGGEAEADLRAQVERLGLGGRIVFTGYIDYAELAEHLLLGDVAINPFVEELVTNFALPGKILQYAACALPTVCTRLEGMRGLLPEGEGVLYRAPGREFADAVVELLDDDERRREVAAAARRAVEARCRWDAAADAFEAAIVRVVEGYRPGG